MMDFGDKGVFAVPVVMMNFGDRGVFVRIPFHPDTLFFWAFYDRCSSFFTGNSARSQNVTLNVQYDTRAKRHAFYMGRVRIRQTYGGRYGQNTRKLNKMPANLVKFTQTL